MLGGNEMFRLKAIHCGTKEYIGEVLLDNMFQTKFRINDKDYYNIEVHWENMTLEVYPCELSPFYVRE
jgi:hypothetical protein